MRFSIAGLLIVAFAGAARADCPWPPLNAREEKQSSPVQVGDATFTTGFYSWWVEHYRVDNLHCTDTVDLRNWWWRVAVGLGGDEPIGPHTSSAADSGSIPPSRRAPLPNLSPMPPLQSLDERSLPEMRALPPLTPPGRKSEFDSSPQRR